MTFHYRGDYRLRLRRATWFADGLRPIHNARGEFVRHEQLRRWEVSLERGTILRCGASRSFTVALLQAVYLVWRAGEK